MIGQSIASGFASIRQRIGLVGLLYAINLIVALLISLPLYLAIRSALGPSGFGPDLLGTFDIMVWSKAMPEMQSAFMLIGLQLLWLVPVLLLWKVASSVGIINALRDGRVRTFWSGVGHFTARGLGLALLFLLLGAFWIAISAFAAILMQRLLGATEAATYNSFFVFLPIAAVVGLSVIALFHDYSKICLVKSDGTVGQAFKRGFKFTLRNPGCWCVFGFWLVISAVLLFVPTTLDFTFNTATVRIVILLFVLQQIFMFLRTAVTVAWYGSEVEYYEAKLWKELPLIAESPLPGPEIAADETTT